MEIPYHSGSDISFATQLFNFNLIGDRSRSSNQEHVYSFIPHHQNLANRAQLLVSIVTRLGLLTNFRTLKSAGLCCLGTTDQVPEVQDLIPVLEEGKSEVFVKLRAQPTKCEASVSY